MKTYLVPTDYSEVADNAAKYAIALAEKEKAKIILFHVFQVPYPVAHDSYFPIISVDELEKDAKIALERYRNKLMKNSGSKIHMECAVAPGFVTESVDSYVKHHHVDLVIMGITGGSKLKEVFVGSNATSVAHNVKSNILIVPAEAKFKEVHKIGFATEFDTENEVKAQKDLKYYADLFNAQVIAINISTDTDLNTPEKAEVMQEVGKEFKDNKFFVKKIESNNVSEEIGYYVSEKNCDWLAVVPKHHNIFGNLFGKSITKKLAYHVDVPILALHEHT